MFKRDLTCSQCGGGCSCEYGLEYELGTESERPASKCEIELVGSDDDGGEENPFKANTSAGGTVILPCLKQSCEIETQWSVTPSWPSEPCVRCVVTAFSASSWVVAVVALAVGVEGPLDTDVDARRSEALNTNPGVPGSESWV